MGTIITFKRPDGKEATCFIFLRRNNPKPGYLGLKKACRKSSRGRD